MNISKRSGTFKVKKVARGLCQRLTPRGRCTNLAVKDATAGLTREPIRVCGLTKEDHES